MAKANNTQTFTFTQARLKKLEPANGEYSVSDADQPGLQCRIYPTGRKVLFIHKRPKGSHKAARVNICTAGELPLNGKDGVRQRARDILSDLGRGINPNEKQRIQKAQEDAQALTLQQAINDYLESANIADSTASSYRSHIERHLKAWLDLPLKSITGSMATKRHREITKKYPSAANNAMRTLRLLFNHFRLELEDDETGDSPIPLSPTRKLKKKWNRETRRRNYIKPGDLETWWQATEAITATRPGTRKEQVPVYAHGDGALGRDYLQFVILTGLRRREATSLTWDDVDLHNQTFTVKKTKNHDPLELPLSDYLLTILQRRKDAAGKNGRIFPCDEPRRFVEWIRKESDVDFTIHDLRRTFSTITESLDIGTLTLKALLNHRIDDRDVTGGYVRISTERLREPMQRITDYILKNAGIKESADVISLEHGNG